MGSPASCTSEKKASVCPETGQTVVTHPDWTITLPEKGYTASVSLINNQIITTSVSGYSSPEACSKTLALLNDVISESFSNGKRYVHIFNMKKCTGISASTRKHYFDEVNAHPGILGHIFCNTTIMFRISLRLGRKLNRRNYGIHIVNNYREAVELALKIISSGLNATNSIQIDTTLKSFPVHTENQFCPVTGLPVIQKKEWTDIDFGNGYKATFRTIGDSILISIPEGSAGVDGLNAFMNKRSEVINDAFGPAKPFFEIKNYERIKTPSRTLRNIFANRMQEETSRFLGFIGFNAPLGIQFSINIGKHLIRPEFPVTVTKNYESAVKFAVSTVNHFKRTGTLPGNDFLWASDYTRDTSRTPSHQINNHVNELLLFLGNINWEMHGLDSNLKRIPKNHPFRIVFEAISLVKTDLDSVSQDRENALEALRKSEKLYRLLAENAHDMIWTCNLDLTPVYISPSARKLTGYSVEYLMNNQMDMTLSRASSVYAAETLMRELENEKQENSDPDRSVLLEFECIHKTGHSYWTETKVSFVRDRHGRPVGLTGVSRDITERKKAEVEAQRSLEELKKAQAQLIESEKMAALGGLVAGVSHEISTPVGVSVTASSFLHQKTEAFIKMKEEGNADPNDFHKFASVVHESTALISYNLKRAAELIQSFKKVAVDQSNEIKRPFDLKLYTEEIIQSLTPNSHDTRFNLNLNCQEGLIFDSFPGSYSQIITNLVMNSVSHGFENSDNGEIYIEISAENNQILITYMDNGKGMDESTLKQIYNPFFTTNRISGGTGLGMHIVYNIITQKLDGQIHCTSTPGNGTTFLIQLPH